MFKLQNKNLGFTLIEILVAIGIFAVITSLLVVRFKEANEQAKIRRAQSDLEQLRIAVEILYQDTGLHPGGVDLSPCVQNSKILLDDPGAGLMQDPGYAGWGGPYITSGVIDPWGIAYEFDARYGCYGGSYGCQGIEDGVWVRAIHSFGPDGSDNGGDDIMTVICRQ